jgi:large subunit ribosomal protein L21
MYAVIKTGGKQYRVANGDVIAVEKLAGDPGSTISLAPVLMLNDDKSSTVGTPIVEGAAVSAEVLEQTRGDKIIVFKKKRRKGYRRTIGHRQDITVLRITDVTGKAKAAPKRAAKPAEKPAEEAKPAAEAEKPAETKPAETKPVETKPAAEKPEAKKAAPKKPAPKKAAPKKPAAKKAAPKKPAAKKAAAKKPAAKKPAAKKPAAKKPAAKKADKE